MRRRDRVPVVRRRLWVLIAVALAFIGCRRAFDTAQLAGEGCLIELDKSVCAPRSVSLEQCRLYIQPDDPAPRPYGQGWSLLEGGLPTPCGADQVALRISDPAFRPPLTSVL